MAQSGMPKLKLQSKTHLQISSSAITGFSHSRDLVLLSCVVESSLLLVMHEAWQQFREQAIRKDSFELFMIASERVAQLRLLILVEQARIEFSLQTLRKFQFSALQVREDDRSQSIAKVVLFTPELAHIGEIVAKALIVAFQRLIEFLDKLFVLDDIGWRDGSPVVEVHNALEVDVEPVDVERCIPERDPVERQRISLSSYDSNHLYRMLTRYINLSRLTHSIRFGFGFFTKLENKAEKEPVPLFKKQQDKGAPVPSTPRPSQSTRDGLQELINKINDSNKYFMGVKLNTNYLKVHNVGKYSQICKQKLAGAKSNDLPIEFSKEKRSLQAFDTFDHSVVLNKKSAKIVFAHFRVERAIESMQELIRSFVISLSREGRLTSVEPNFEANIIKIRNSLADKIKLTLKNQEALPEIKIKDITLLKGLSVFRNDNYSTDSYQKDESEATDGIVHYTLYRQPKERYPEQEWFSTKRINARFELLVRGGPVLEVSEGGSLLGSTENVVHNVVIEADLTPPPAISEHQLGAEQFLRSYRFQGGDCVVTNFDRKNSFYALTFTENEKKSLLINKIE